MNEMQKVKPTNRVAEMVLGIMGSIFGILGGLFAIMLQGVSSQLDTDGGNVGGLGVAVIITCIITLILSCIINKKRVLIGVLLIIGGILNFIFISFFWNSFRNLDFSSRHTSVGKKINRLIKIDFNFLIT